MFFRGDRKSFITHEEIIDQILSAEAKEIAGTAHVSKSAPKSNEPVVDVREFVLRQQCSPHGVNGSHGYQ